MRFFYLIFLSIVLIQCNNDYQPKPRGFFRISFPEKKYLKFTSQCNYNFEYPNYSVVKDYEGKNAEKCWYNLEFHQFDAKLHLSYKKIEHNLPELIEDSRTFVYKHTIKADAINELLINKPEKKVFGILYELEGNTASTLQFFITDSTENFLRGALYFDVNPNKDSLNPVNNFIRKDIDHLIDTFFWK